MKQKRRRGSPDALLILSLLAAAATGCDRDPEREDHQGHDERPEEPEGHGADEPGVVALDPSAASRIGVRVEEAIPSEIAPSIEVPAEVHFNPNRLAHVTPLVPGQLVEVYADLGDEVEAGDALAKFRSVEFGKARAELGRADSMVELAEATAARQTKLRELGIASERASLEARQALAAARAERRAARARLSVLGARGGSGSEDVIRAPIAGTIVERHATRGEYVRPQDKLFVVGDLSTVWVLGRVPEGAAGGVEAGARAIVSMRSDPDRSWSGTVDYVASRIDEETRTLEVRSEFANEDRALRPGLFGSMRVRTRDGRAAPGAASVPEAAVQELEGSPVVFVPVPGEPSSFRAVPVLAGRREAGRVEILGGIGPGQAVVVEGAFALKSQSVRGELGEGHAH